VDFLFFTAIAIFRSLVRPYLPNIRLLFWSRLCYMFPPDPASRQRLALRQHFTSIRFCGGLSPQVVEHARHTQKVLADIGSKIGIKIGKNIFNIVYVASYLFV
jgi:hypothetical protein